MYISFRKVRNLRKSALAIAFILLGGCANFAHQNLICKADGSTLEIQTMMKQACAGDKGTQYALGSMFEKGRDVAQDYTLALAYYKLAASPNSGQTHIYVPAAGNVAGYTMPVQTGVAHAGDPLAKYRLGVMYRDGLGVKPDKQKAEGYFAEAQAQGVSGPEL